ncbi:MAG: flavin reductase family protein [Ruminococcaceae bacterium]|nr:flavin reductase family protein [Oscillospiraceae bacterium]
MSKIVWKPGTLLSPVPVVLVSSGAVDSPNAVTVAWTGIVNTNPSMLYISLRPERHSHKIISESGEFVVNLVTRDLVRKTDSCGVYTGAKVNKFKKFNLTPEKASQVSSPMIKESPVNIECKVEKIIPLGTHDMFLARIVAVNVEESLIGEGGKLELKKAKLIAYSHGDYLELGKKVGSFGYSVKKKKQNRVK